MNMKFDLPKDQSSIIKVIGVGGGGSNAVNHMCLQGIEGVDFVVCNTDQQALDSSPVPIKIQLGASLTEGLGAGSIAEVGKNAAVENIEEIRTILEKNTKMVFITAGMGGGTGTGGAPVIAKTAKDMGILTVGIVTVPFAFEGRKRKQQAEKGLEEIRNSVDTLLIINNDKLREMYGNLTLTNAFEQADDVLTTAAKGIAEVITRVGGINVDFNDVNTVMKESGVAIMGSAKADGDDRAINAVAHALASPLLNDNNIEGANYVLLNITYGDREVLMDEITDITEYIQDEAGSSADIIWGHGYDESLGDAISVTIIATGFKGGHTSHLLTNQEPEKKYVSLDQEPAPKPVETPSPVGNPITNPIHTPTSQQVTSSMESNRELEEGEPYLKTSTPQANLEDQAQAPSEDQVAQQASMEFESSSSFNTMAEEPSVSAPESVPPTQEVKRFYLEEDGGAEEAAPEASSEMDREQFQQRADDRISRIRELSMRLKTPSGISDLENEPAYKRRNIQLNEVPHSSESTVSRYTLSEEEDASGEKRTEIKPNNSFLHDNVD